MGKSSLVYQDIKIHAGDVFFKIQKPKETSHWGLVDRHNKAVLPKTYLDVNVVNKNFFCTLEPDNKWVLRDSLGDQILLTRWINCEPLNQHLISLTQEGGINKLFSCERKDTIPLSIAKSVFRPCNDSYIQYRNNGSAGLLDNKGDIVIPARYQDIQPTWDSLFRVQLRGSGWGMYSLTRGLISPCKYDRIGELKGRFAIVETADLKGLVDTSLQELIPPAFDRLVVTDSLIKGYENGALSLFKVTADGQVALLDEFANVQTLRVGFNNKFYMEAQPLKNKQLVVRGAFDLDASPYTAQTDGRWQWKRNPDTKKWGLADQQTGSSNGIPPAFLDVLHLKNPELSLVFTDEKTTSNTPQILPAIYTVESFPRAALFSHQTGKFISSFDILGLRGQDFNDRLPLAVFLDKNGRFGLIDRRGKTAALPNGEPLRFTWIGSFHDGMARFCQGGRLALAEEGKQSKTEVDVVGNLMVQFGMYTTSHFSSIQERSLVVEKIKEEPLQWGYIDTLGRVVIESRFNFAGDFLDSFAVNQIEGLWGVIDQKGNEKIPFKYSSVSSFHNQWLVGEKSTNRLIFNPNGYERITKLYNRQGQFSEDRCPVQMDSLWGFIDEEGNEVIQCQFEAVRNFSEGLAAVQKKGQWSFIDRQGHPAIELQNDQGEISEVGDFSNGLAWFKVGYYYGYLDQSGRVKIPLDFTKVFDFKFGVARAVFKGKTGLIDTTGHWILKPARFEYVSDFNQWGVAEAREKFKGKRCLVNAKGQILTPLKYTSISEFHEGFATISDGDSFGLLNTHGKEILPLEYSAIGRVSEGLVAVRPARSYAWHFVDTLGQKAFKGEFEQVKPFQFGHAFVQVNHFDPTSRFVIDKMGKRLVINQFDQFEFYENGIFGLYTPNGEKEGFRRLNYYFADNNGHPLFDRLFEKIEPFKGETALVGASGRWGMLNRNGLFVVPPKYPLMNMQENDEAVVNLPLLFGLLTKDGATVFPTAFDRIELMSGNRFRLEMGEKVGYAKKNGDWVWELQK
ncbi:MAG: WG repeat-containing protein [Saprospiraceae bacterium]